VRSEVEAAARIAAIGAQPPVEREAPHREHGDGVHAEAGAAEGRREVGRIGERVARAAEIDHLALDCEIARVLVAQLEALAVLATSELSAGSDENEYVPAGASVDCGRPQVPT
jgi:hypothetical protein